ncbi:MMPL family transporter, partial [uncultured Rhodospira sp.]|uniref:MMPL family transporter n=1 Tax=uncultured Rhodospira sp. TaxID=1936189 RepID=UPI00262EF150
MSRIIGQWAGKADRVFQAVARAIYRSPLKALVFVLLLVGLGVSGLPNLRKDGRIEAFMHETDPALQAYYDMRHSFGQDNRIVVTISAPDVFTTSFLTRLADLHRDIQRDVPYIAELFSLYNIPFIQYEDGGIYLEELVRNMLHRGWDPDVMRDRVMATPLYRNFILSEDGKTASIIIEPYRYAPSPNDCIARPEQGISCDNTFRPVTERQLLGPPQYAEMAAQVQAIIATYQDPETFDIHVSGAPIVSTEIVALMSKDMPRFTLLCIGVTILVILVLYRSLLVAIAALFVVAAPSVPTIMRQLPPTRLDL